MQDIETQQDSKISFRTIPKAADRETVKNIVSSTGFFNSEEIDISVELVDEALASGEASGYNFIFAEMSNQVLGYTCFGPIPGCHKRHEIYWIAVEKTYHRLGIGKILLQKTEEAIRSHGAERAYIETSSRAEYKPTQLFYMANGYSSAAEIEDYFQDGDGKIIFMKRLAHTVGQQPLIGIVTTANVNMSQAPNKI
jgi:ribosomal protein S18 acetylase RimI-like enzyme